MFDHVWPFFNAFFVWVFSVFEEDVPEKEPEAGEDAEKPVHSDHDQLTHICNSILSTEIDQVVEDFWWSYPKSMDNSCGWWPPSRPCCPALRKDDAGGAAETDVWWEQRSGCTSWACVEHSGRWQCVQQTKPSALSLLCLNQSEKSIKISFDDPFLKRCS